ncbi:hypothetical protein [Curtobacterium sp. MCBD17_032]|uniref:hypothetical protein n=1 Tax=Curtobacterium sp. MCBD17_032 TaxID=2175659 RepID=UPI000DA7C0AF|nr:hypothetical protein [Curtobacterium sp. MCBD17_032]PZE85256.1 hypothetical protein DEI91_07510 [Curtobacterium sp. MCBD17_032]
MGEQGTGHVRRAGTAVAAVAALLLVTGCSMLAGGSVPDAAPTDGTPRRTAAPSPSATPRPTPTVTTPPVAELVGVTLDAGDVGEGAPATVSGTGPADVAFRVRGDFAVVMDLDCSRCTGTAAVTAPGRMSPFGEASAPLTASFLTGVMRSDPDEQMLIVQADGPWSMTMRSWNDLPSVSGPQAGTGPAVLFFSDDVSHVQVEYTPADADDRFGARVFTTSDDTQLFGDTEAFSDTFEADLPGVVAIATNGSWRITPTP